MLNPRILAAAACLAAGVASAQSDLAACSSGQLPYQLGTGQAAGSPAGACFQWLEVNSPAWSFVAFEQGYCLVRNTQTNSLARHQVQKVCEPASPYFADPAGQPGLTDVKVNDYMSMFWSFVLVLVVVFGLKQLLNFFTRDHEPQ